MISSRKFKFAVTAAAATAIVCTGAMAADITSTTDVNVRSGPGNSYSVLTVMQKGVPATKLGQSGNWVQVSVNGKTGYVYSKYISGYAGSTGSNNSSSSGSSSDSSASGTVYITASGLNVRSGPSTSYGVIGTLSKNQGATVVGSSNGWYKISYGGGYGYISSKYTTASQSSSGSNSSQNDGSSSNTSGSVMYSTTAGLNVRSGPGTSYSSIGNLSLGQEVSVVDSSSYWYKISYGGGYGYVGSKYLSSTKPSASTGNSGSSNSSSGSSSSGNSSSMVSYAMQFVGCSYVYGAAGPNSFDCSGFTQYVYAHFGKSIPRSSASQYASCSKISKSSLQPGDLVFFSNSSSGGSVGHVGIYIGDGQMVHAANRKSGVCVASINSSYYSQHYIGSGRY